MKKFFLFLLIFVFVNSSCTMESFRRSTTQASQLDAEYAKEFTDIIEFVYGSEFLSQGGSASIDMMFKGHKLDGKKVLDVGSGLGGVDFYLAKKYKVHIVGIDRVLRLVQDASARKENHALEGEVVFIHQETDTDLSKFDDASFDLIFSKECILHVDNEKKVDLFKELYRVLKPGGQLIILDWLVPAHELGPNIKHMMEVDGLDLKMAMPEEYRRYLQESGFTGVALEKKNQDYIVFTEDNIQKIKSSQNELIKKFTEKDYEYCLSSWGSQKKLFENNEVEVTLIKATKPS